jgi:hypothetical protein
MVIPLPGLPSRVLPPLSGLPFQELPTLDTMEVVLGEPKLVFSETNNAGELFQGFFELVGPPISTPGVMKHDSAATPAPLAEPPKN